MDDARGVRIVERHREIVQDGHRVIGRERLLTREPITQALTRHVLHDEVQQAARFARRIHGNDVRMTEPGYRPRLLNEALPDLGAGADLGRDDLDRDRPVEGLIPSEEDRAHAALSKRPLDAVLPGERLRETGQQVGRVGNDHMREDDS